MEAQDRWWALQEGTIWRVQAQRITHAVITKVRLLLTSLQAHLEPTADLIVDFRGET